MIHADFVTDWIKGETMYTPCTYNPVTRHVSDIGWAEDPGFDMLRRTYIELPSGEEIDTFFDADANVWYLNGQRDSSSGD